MGLSRSLEAGLVLASKELGVMLPSGRLRGWVIPGPGSWIFVGCSDFEDAFLKPPKTTTDSSEKKVDWTMTFGLKSKFLILRYFASFFGSSCFLLLVWVAAKKKKPLCYASQKPTVQRLLVSVFFPCLLLVAVGFVVCGCVVCCSLFVVGVVVVAAAVVCCRGRGVVVAVVGLWLLLLLLLVLLVLVLVHARCMHSSIRHTTDGSVWSFGIRSGPLQQGSISSVVRAMALWAIGCGLNPRMEHFLLHMPLCITSFCALFRSVHFFHMRAQKQLAIV